MSEELSTSKLLTALAVIMIGVFGWLGNIVIHTQADLKVAIHDGQTRLAVIEERLETLEQKGSD